MKPSELKYVTPEEMVLYLLKNKRDAIRFNHPYIDPHDGGTWHYYEIRYTRWQTYVGDGTPKTHTKEGFTWSFFMGEANHSGDTSTLNEDWCTFEQEDFPSEQIITKIYDVLERGFIPCFPRFEIPV